MVARGALLRDAAHGGRTEEPGADGACGTPAALRGADPDPLRRRLTDARRLRPAPLPSLAAGNCRPRSERPRRPPGEGEESPGEEQGNETRVPREPESLSEIPRMGDRVASPDEI